MTNRPPVPLGDADGRLFVAVPTAGDLVDLEARREKPDAILWYLVRFLVDADGRPFLRSEDDARGIAANVAQRLVEVVGEQLTARP